MVTNVSGRGWDWEVQYRNNDVEGYTGEEENTSTRKNLWKRCTLGVRGYRSTDSIKEREQLENRGQNQIIDVFGKMVDRLMTSVKQTLGTQVYVDGNASGNSKKWHGIESFMGNNGTIHVTAGTQRTANALDPYGYPTDTYAGLTTGLGDYGGSNASGSVWPEGIADAEYDFFSPLIVNYTSTAWGGSANTWKAQGDECMRHAIIHSQRNNELDEGITQAVMSRKMYAEFKHQQADKERIAVTSTTGLKALGFGNVTNFDGIELTWDNGVSGNVAYGWSIGMVTLKCMYESLLKSVGPYWVEDDVAWKANVRTLSNLTFKSPRNFFKLQALA
jgi:hypothetical protein